MQDRSRRLQRSPLGGSPSVVAGLAIWNAGNYAFFLLAGRMLGPADYGMVAALLAITLIVLVPSGALQVGVSRHLASLGDSGRSEGDEFVRQAFKWAALTGVGLGVTAVAVALVVDPTVGTAAIVLTGLAIVPMGVFSVGLGTLQGQQRFGAFAAGLGMLGAPRPIMLILLAAVAGGVPIAMGATAITMFGAASVTFLLAWPRTPRGLEPVVAWRSFLPKLAPLSLGLVGVSLLLNVDVIVAKVSLSDHTAGQFGAVAVLAKAVTLLPQALSWVLLPRIARARSHGECTGPLLAVGAAITIIGGILATSIGWIAGGPITELAFGSDYADGGALLGPLIAVASLVGVLMLLLNHHVGLGQSAFVWMVVALASIEVVLFALFHDSWQAIIWVEAVVGFAGIALHEVRFGRGDDGLLRSIVLLVGPSRKTVVWPSTK